MPSFVRIAAKRISTTLRCTTTRSTSVGKASLLSAQCAIRRFGTNSLLRTMLISKGVK
jgi:hypothetical protein